VVAVRSNGARAVAAPCSYSRRSCMESRELSSASTARDAHRTPAADHGPPDHGRPGWPAAAPLGGVREFHPLDDRGRVPRHRTFLERPSATRSRRTMRGSRHRVTGRARARVSRPLARRGGWACRWIAAHAHARVLDAGSGYGTFAMLFAAMGAEVTAVDVRPDRSVADRRWRSTRGRAAAAPRAPCATDSRRLGVDAGDLVWVYNALSHIDPVEHSSSGCGAAEARGPDRRR